MPVRYVAPEELLQRLGGPATPDQIPPVLNQRFNVVGAPKPDRCLKLDTRTIPCVGMLMNKAKCEVRRRKRRIESERPLPPQLLTSAATSRDGVPGKYGVSASARLRPAKALA